MSFNGTIEVYVRVLTLAGLLILTCFMIRDEAQQNNIEFAKLAEYQIEPITRYNPIRYNYGEQI